MIEVGMGDAGEDGRQGMLEAHGFVLMVEAVRDVRRRHAPGVVPDCIRPEDPAACVALGFHGLCRFMEDNLCEVFCDRLALCDPVTADHTRRLVPMVMDAHPAHLPITVVVSNFVPLGCPPRAALRIAKAVMDNLVPDTAHHIKGDTMAHLSTALRGVDAPNVGELAAAFHVGLDLAVRHLGATADCLCSHMPSLEVTYRNCRGNPELMALWHSRTAPLAAAMGNPGDDDAVLRMLGARVDPPRDVDTTTTMEVDHVASLVGGVKL